MKQTFELLEGMFVQANAHLGEALMVYYHSKYFVLPIPPPSTSAKATKRRESQRSQRDRWQPGQLLEGDVNLV